MAVPLDIRQKPAQIILDTNFLLIPGQFKVDIFLEIARICNFQHELCVVFGTQDELQKIIKHKKSKMADKTAAKIGLELIKKKNINTVMPSSMLILNNRFVDDIILDYCSQEQQKINKAECIVATQDAELAKKLKNLGIRTIRLRKKQYLEIL